ncbi:hypothetical protein [Pseudocitrobacter faecalis]|uniref:hypothetical protein n=1 Tax=Pseudocitrobacter faecalis TaxID=1398493 RepID=UPI00331503DA
MTINKLTDEQIDDLLECIEVCEKMSVSNYRMASALRELQEYRKADVTPNNEGSKQPSSKKTIGVNDFIDAMDQESSKYPR